MDKACRRAKFFRGLLTCGLCYFLALYAFVVAFSAALSLPRENGTSTSFLICHNSRGDTPVPADSDPLKIPCALCVIGAAAALPLNCATVADVSPELSLSISFIDARVVAELPFVRAGLSRGPPNVA